MYAARISCVSTSSYPALLAWLLTGQSDDPSWCDGFCLKCTVTPPDSSPAYHPSFTSNISVNLANYGDATDLALFVFTHLSHPAGYSYYHSVSGHSGLYTLGPISLQERLRRYRHVSGNCSITIRILLRTTTPSMLAIHSITVRVHSRKTELPLKEASSR